jgi:hypothetical protein
MNCHFGDSSMGKISNFLLNSHKSKINNVVNNKIINKENFVNKASKDGIIVLKKAVIKSCGKCESTNVEIVYGRYGYYFKCKNCNGNTSIKIKCKENSCKVRIRKAKLKFYKECSSCGTSELYFENEEVISEDKRITA